MAGGVVSGISAHAQTELDRLLDRAGREKAARQQRVNLTGPHSEGLFQE